MNLMHIKVGDTLVLRDVSMRGPRRVRVTKVGTKHLTIDSGRTFRRISGVVVGKYIGYLVTVEQADLEERAAVAEKELLSIRVVMLRGTDPSHTLRVAELLAPLLKETPLTKDARDELPHPMQPIVRDDYGVLRFKENRILGWLFDVGKIDLNEIARRGFPEEDNRQLAQLLGYSTSGYGELSYVSDEDYAAVEAACVPHRGDRP